MALTRSEKIKLNKFFTKKLSLDNLTGPKTLMRIFVNTDLNNQDYFKKEFPTFPEFFNIIKKIIKCYKRTRRLINEAKPFVKKEEKENDFNGAAILLTNFFKRTFLTK